MKSVLITAPATTPVSLDEIKAHCVISGTADDVYLTGLVGVAVDYIESTIGRKLITQTHKLLLDEWPGAGLFELPFSELQSVTSIAYTDYEGTDSTFSSDDYTVDTESELGRVVLGYDKSWPSVSLHNVNPIQVTFICGYGDADDVPQTIKHAIKLLVAHWYENREIALIGTVINNIPKTADALTWPHRLVAF